MYLLRVALNPQSKLYGRAMTLGLSQRGLGMEQSRAAEAMLALG